MALMNCRLKVSCVVAGTAHLRIHILASAFAGVCARLRSSACVYQHSFASACVHLRSSACSRLNVRTRLDAMDLCVWTRLLFKDFRDVL